MLNTKKKCALELIFSNEMTFQAVKENADPKQGKHLRDIVWVFLF